MIIDSHCHIYPDKIAAKASAATGNFYTLPMFCNGTVSELLSCGEKAGIDAFVVCSVATTPHQVHSINNFIAQAVNDNPGKIFGIGALHPDSEDIEGDIENLIELGLKGVKLHPDIQGFKLDYEGCLKIYEICEKKKLPVLIHTGDKRYDNSNPDRLIPLLKAYPELTVIGAHFGGWSIWEKAAQQLCNMPNLYVDCSSSFYSLDDETAKELISAYGEDRVLFGSDYPMWEPEKELARLHSLYLGKEAEEKILYKNACRVFNILCK